MCFAACTRSRATTLQPQRGLEKLRLNDASVSYEPENLGTLVSPSVRVFWACSIWTIVRERLNGIRPLAHRHRRALSIELT